MFPLCALIAYLWPVNNYLQARKQQRARMHAVLARYVEYQQPTTTWIEDEPELPNDVCIWCDGTPIPQKTTVGQAQYQEVQRRAILRGMYNSKNLEDGGWFDMQVDYYRIQGFSRNRAEELVGEQIELGLSPSLFYCPQPQP